MIDSRALERRRLVLVELNEINFDIAGTYVERLKLTAFARLLGGASIRTSSELKYEELEPWIQWPSVHSGKSSAEHGVFRLGDIVGTKIPQVFEQLEELGFSVGCVSPMNAENRLRTPAYFLPDPWTKTPPDRSWWSRSLSAAISQAVNENATGRISAKSVAYLAMGLIRFARPVNYKLYARLAGASRGAPWRKALLLDLFLHDLHWQLFRAKAPDFSTVFFNAGAHIQHHYLFNSSVASETGPCNPKWYVGRDVDPVAEMLQVYDRIVADYLSLPDVDVVVATGLSQRPYDRLKFYYRLRDHSSFLSMLGIGHRNVLPRMTRDFLVEFDSKSDAAAAQQRLKQVRVVGRDEPLFGDIDNRGHELFVSMTYPNEIDTQTMIELGGNSMPLAPHVAFVAIKNGMHQGMGFAFFTPGIHAALPVDGAHVKFLHATIMQFFGAPAASDAALATSS